MSLRGKQRWSVAGFFFLAGILAASWNARIPDVQQHLLLNNAQWGTVLVALPAGLVTGLFLSSWLVARFGTARVTLFTCILACILLLLIGFAADRISLMIVLFFVGFNRTIMNISINTRSVEVQKLYDKPIISTFHGIWSLACFVAAGIGTVMIIFDVIPKIHFALIAVLGIIGSLLNRGNMKEGHEAPEKKPFLIRPDAYLFLLGLIAFCGMAAENTMFDWSINYYDKIIQTDKSWRTAGYTCFIITMSMGRLVGDRLIHRYGALRMLAFNGFLMATGFAIASLMPTLIIASLGFLLIGFGDSSIVPIVYSLAGKAKMPMAYAIASVTTIGYLGFLINPLIVGFVSEALNMRWAFGLMAVFAIGIALLSALVSKRADK